MDIYGHGSFPCFVVVSMPLPQAMLDLLLRVQRKPVALSWSPALYAKNHPGTHGSMSPDLSATSRGLRKLPQSCSSNHGALHVQASQRTTPYLDVRFAKLVSGSPQVLSFLRPPTRLTPLSREPQEVGWNLGYHPLAPATTHFEYPFSLFEDRLTPINMAPDERHRHKDAALQVLC